MPTRQEMWDRLGEPTDLLVIGGGINGAGIARDAALRGLKVTVVEMRDLAWGTSSRSSKLVHGGLRYLEQMEFGLVFESVSERRILLDIAPHLVNPLGFLFPVFKESRRGLASIKAGMWLYEGLSLFRSPRRHRQLKPADLKREEPCLRQIELKGAPLYYDCSTDDARLTLESALDGVANGAVVVPWARASRFLRDENGMICGALVEDAHTGATKEVRAHAVINATGPWTDLTRQLVDAEARPLLRPTKGVHIVVDTEKLPLNNSVVCFHPEDERVLFAIPWGDRTYIGTTDTDFEGDPSDVVAELADVDYLIAAAGFYFPDHPLCHDDVISTWAGLRPLMSPVKGDSVDESAVSREHQIIMGNGGLITVAGGKLTTFRKMSAEVVDTAVKLLRLGGHLPGKLSDPKTDERPLPGAVGWPEDDDHGAVAAQILAAAKGKLEADTAALLADTYGTRGVAIAKTVVANPALGERLAPDRPEILAQVDWAVMEELASTVYDVLTLRTQVYFRAHDQGLGAAPAVAARMATLLGWDEDTVAARLAQFEEEVAASRRWRSERPA